MLLVYGYYKDREILNFKIKKKIHITCPHCEKAIESEIEIELEIEEFYYVDLLV